MEDGSEARGQLRQNSWIGPVQYFLQCLDNFGIILCSVCESVVLVLILRYLIPSKNSTEVTSAKSASRCFITVTFYILLR